MVLGAALLNTQHYKLQIKGKEAMEKGALESPSTKVAYFTFINSE